ncbi:MAG: acetate--CoA ligase family protein, partial [Desulfobacterium sp.]|nr:acetate--CoA ligase family protein [Desulfobacterium sp.]
IILTPQSMTDAMGTAEAIVNIARNAIKPIVCAFMGVVDVSDGVKLLQKNRVPVYQFPESAARAMGVLYRNKQWLSRKILPQYDISFDAAKAGQIVKDCLDRGETTMGELDGSRLLACYGFHTLDMALARTGEEAVAIADRIGYPIVMKIVSKQILHKSDARGVRVGIKTPEEVKEVFEEILESAKEYNSMAKLDGVLVQESAKKGREVILGVSRDDVFGHAVMFGLGGIFVEVYKDVVFRMAPMGRNVARRMVRGIKGYPLLAGVRGEAPSDIEALEKNLVSLREMVTNHPEIKELDINPLFVHATGEGTTVADVIIKFDPRKS